MEEAAKVIAAARDAIPSDNLGRDKLAHELGRQLCKLPPFNSMQKKLLNYGDGSAASATGFLGSIILEMLLLGQTPDEIVSQAAADIDSNVCAWLEVRPILGLRVSTIHELSEGVVLMPNHELPPSPYNDGAFSHGSVIFNYRSDTAALVAEAFVKPALEPQDRDVSRRLPVSPTPDLFVEDLCRALALAGRGPILSTVRYGIPRRPSVLSGRRGIYYSLSYGHIPHNEEVDIDLAKEILSKLQSFEGYAPLKIAIDRLSSARASVSLINKAIDLGMALEIAMMHGDERPDQEIRYKVSTRAGWLVGETPDDRQVASKLARSIYDARSSAVHKGEVNPKKFSFSESAIFVQQCLIAIVEKQRFPNWSDLTFGGNG